MNTIALAMAAKAFRSTAERRPAVGSWIAFWSYERRDPDIASGYYPRRTSSCAYRQWSSP